MEHVAGRDSGSERVGQRGGRTAEAPPGVQVRRMTRADVDVVVGIESDAFSSPWSAETFSSLLERPGLELLVLEHEEEGVIGYAVLWCIIDQGELANVALTPRMRGRGLGRHLLGCVMDLARERGIETIFLEVRASNERAHELYRGFGFSDVGRRKAYYDHPREDALIMAAKL
ncbi:MAG TPA: ribosomal protein S18-alanine N-acetyltransferase [Candidatus Limnocylindrales bacterium]|nr:ribosomal protein S18-alanine N-acetyltransferase [Candidatus Limnocylindrales bacterium]